MKSRVCDRMRSYALNEHSTAFMLADFLETRDPGWGFELFHSKRVYDCISQYFDGGQFDR